MSRSARDRWTLTGRGPIFWLVSALLVTLAVLTGVSHTTFSDQADLRVYLSAGENLLRTGNPYDLDASSSLEVFRCGPWFALPWALLVNAPYELVAVGWLGLLTISAAAVLIDLVRRHGIVAIPLAALMASLLAGSISGGNVQPLIVAVLWFGLPARTAPVWIAACASLKLVPILYVLPWVGRREYGKVAVALSLTALLALPAFLFEHPTNLLDPGIPGIADEFHPAVWVAVALIAVIVALRFARSAHAWLAAGAAAALSIPRLLPLDWSILLPAVRGPRQSPVPRQEAGPSNR